MKALKPRTPPDDSPDTFRTALPVLVQRRQCDLGATWSQAESTTLASSRAPAALNKRIPGTDDLLIIWNQSSADEIERGTQRHRLSSAISKDGGETWQRGRNVFIGLPTSWFYER